MPQTSSPFSSQVTKIKSVKGILLKIYELEMFYKTNCLVFLSIANLEIRPVVIKTGESD